MVKATLAVALVQHQYDYVVKNSGFALIRQWS